MAETHSVIKFRPALPEDYEAVMAIGEQYHGMDYLPACYHDYMNDPYRYCSLGEVDGKVVTFHMVYIVDDGKAAVGEAARTHPDYRRQGFLDKAAEFNIKRIDNSRRYPYLTKSYSISHDSAKWLNRQSDKKQFIVARNSINVKITPNTFATYLTQNFLDNKITETSAHKIQKLNIQETLNALSSQQNLQRLFPTGYFGCAGEPFKAIGCNFDRVLSETYRLYVFADIMPGYVCRSLSFGVLRNCRLGIKYDIDIYGTDSIETVKGHIIQHVSYLRFCEIHKDVVFRINFEGPRENLDIILGYCLSDLGMELGPRHQNACIQFMIVSDMAYIRKQVSHL